MSGSSDLPQAVRKLVARSNLSDPEIEAAFDSILSGSANEASMAAFLVALSMKGATAPELRAMIAATRKHATPITPKVHGRIIDTCGTGGDSIRSFNISTASAIVACAAGAIVAKHGNRSVSGICGSADFLEHIGLPMDAPAEKVRAGIEDVGFGFLFAPMFHPLMKNVSGVRKAIGVRTVFNIIGPLCNPCTNLSGQVIGVFEPALMDLLAEAYQGCVQDAMIVHAVDGFDELSNTCENDVLRIKGEDNPQRLRIHPKVLGIPPAKPEQLVVNSKDESIRSTLQVIYGQAPPEKEDIVIMNTSAALVVAKVASDLKEGVSIARTAIRSGKAKEKLSQIIGYFGEIEKLREAEKKFL
jgi:anthranilate phosphoribosyltransferase